MGLFEKRWRCENDGGSSIHPKCSSDAPLRSHRYLGCYARVPTAKSNAQESLQESQDWIVCFWFPPLSRDLSFHFAFDGNVSPSFLPEFGGGEGRESFASSLSQRPAHRSADSFAPQQGQERHQAKRAALELCASGSRARPYAVPATASAGLGGLSSVQGPLCPREGTRALESVRHCGSFSPLPCK